MPSDEKWKQIADFPDYYISSLGRIKSVRLHKERLLKPWVTSNGYKRIRLHRNIDGMVQTSDLYIHRLVA